MKCPKELYDKCIKRHCPYHKDCATYLRYILFAVLLDEDW